MSVLKEEKRDLLRQLYELNELKLENGTTDSRLRSRSLSNDQNFFHDSRSNNSASTRDMGTMCGVVTRDVGVSHQQV